MDEVDEPDEVDETLPAALVTPALLGAAPARVAAPDTGAVELPRVERNGRPFWLVAGFDTAAVRTVVVRVGRVARVPTLEALTSS